MGNLEETVGSMGTTKEVTGWAIGAMSEEETEEVHKTWQERTGGRETLGDGCSIEGVKEKAVWVETSLTDIPKSHPTAVRVSHRSKRWWTPKVAARSKEYDQI